MDWKKGLKDLKKRERILPVGLLLLLILFSFFPNLTDGIISQEQAILIIVGCSVVLILYQFHGVDQRMTHLANVADSIRSGDYTARSIDLADDSVGKLAQAVNKMADEIQHSFEELEKSNAKLEQSSAAMEESNNELSRIVERQEKFGEFLSKISSIEINVIANAALESLTETTNSQVGVFYIHDNQKNVLVPISRKSIDQAVLRSFASGGAMEGFPGEVMRQKKWLSIEEIDPEALPDINIGVGMAKIRNIYGIPVVFQKNFLGVIVLAGLRSVDTATKQILSNQVEALANSITNAITYRSVQKQSIQLEEANQGLLAAHKQKSEFVANMSHELRTPLNSIIGFSGILLKNRNGVLGDAELNRVEKINRNGKHLLSLINDILDLSKIEAGRMDIIHEDVDLVPVLRDVVDMLHPQADAKKLALKFEASESSIMTVTDGHKLKQVIINLVGNAIKFTREGSVTLRCSSIKSSTPKVRIQVVDTGIGIRPESLDLIFQAFTQEDSSTSREFGGTGLGLTISRSIIELLGGKLTVFSEGTNKGSTFSVELPVKKESAAAAPKPASKEGDGKEEVKAETDGKDGAIPSESEQVPTFQVTDAQGESSSELKKVLPLAPGKRILVVDDDPDAREFIIQYVKEMGAEYKECGDSRQVVEMVKSFKPDLITLDIMMPESNGWEVLGWLKAEEETANVPVVVVSMVADKNKAVSLGAVDALNKPVIQRDFLACIRRTLNSDRITNRKILIVDDLPEYQELMRLWLDESINEIRTASNGKEALEVLDSFRPDVIFLDLMMPVMDGLTFLQRFRAREEFADIPVIVITAKNLSNAERKWLESRAEKIMTKGEEIFNDPLQN